MLNSNSSAVFLVVSGCFQLVRVHYHHCDTTRCGHELVVSSNIFTWLATPAYGATARALQYCAV